MPVVDKKVSDMSHTWPIVSRVIAAVLGGFMVTYWTGAAVTKREQFEVLSGEFLNLLRQFREASPEIGRGVTLQRSVDLPLL